MPSLEEFAEELPAEELPMEDVPSELEDATELLLAPELTPELTPMLLEDPASSQVPPKVHKGFASGGVGSTQSVWNQSPPECTTCSGLADHS